MSYPAPIFNYVPGLAKSMHPKAIFTRASTGSVWDSSGILRSASSGLPRFDADPLTGACKGFLVEESRANLLSRSEDFSNAPWAKTRATISANASVAPDGTTTADKLVEDSNDGHHACAVPSVMAASTQYTLSIFAKSAERSRIQVGCVRDDGNFAGSVFDLSNGTWVKDSYGTPDKYSIEPVGNGWYRCSVTLTNSASGTDDSAGVWMVNDVLDTYLGDGTSGLYIWGAQLEAGSFPTSYIPTTTTQVTRAADVCTVTLANLVGPHGEPLWNGTEGTLLVSGRVNSIPAGAAMLTQIDDGTNNNRLCMYVYSPNNVQNRCTVSGSQYDTPLSVGASVVTGGRFAFAFKSGLFAACANGGSVSTNTYNMPGASLVTMRLGSAVSDAFLNGHIRQLTLWNRRLSNAQLQALTA